MLTLIRAIEAAFAGAASGAASPVRYYAFDAFPLAIFSLRFH